MSYWRLARQPGLYTLYFTGYNEMMAIGRGAMLNRICVKREINSELNRVEDWVTSVNDREGVLESIFTCQIDIENNTGFIMDGLVKDIEFVGKPWEWTESRGTVERGGGWHTTSHVEFLELGFKQEGVCNKGPNRLWEFRNSMNLVTEDVYANYREDIMNMKTKYEPKKLDPGKFLLEHGEYGT